MTKRSSKSNGSFFQSLADSIVRVYAAGGYLLVFIFVGGAMMFGSKWSAGAGSYQLGVLGAILMFACLALFGWGHIYAALEANRRMPGVRKFCERLVGPWWERIDAEEGSALSIFWIEQELFSDSVRLRGTSYDREGNPAAVWNSAMAQVVPMDNRLEYLWQGWHQKKDVNVDFHGFGEMTFEGPSDSAERVVRGGGRFWSVDQTKRTAILKPIRLRRIADNDPRLDTMRNGTDTEIAALVKKILAEW